MKLCRLAPAEAIGAVLVHTTRAGALVLKKGRVLDERDVAALAGAGVAQVACALPEPGDVGEDEAARALAEAIGGPGLVLEEAKTGRCNLRAAASGLCLVDARRLFALNVRDERITAATLGDGAAVRAGEVVATVKIIPFAVPRQLLAELVRSVRSADNTSHVRDSDELNSTGHRRSDKDRNVRDSDHPKFGRNDPDLGHPDRAAVVAIAPWQPRRAGLILTRFADTHERVLQRAEEAQRERMARCGGELAQTTVVAHDEAAVAASIAAQAQAGLEPILVLGASAIMDREDVIPSALRSAGGRLERLGMPVDPGNLLMIGHLADGRTVLGVPGCARSLKRSGFDWVLERVCAGVTWRPQDIAALGVGGLLDEGELRPSPRGGKAAAGNRPTVGAVVLAAGKSTRMGSAKLLEPLEDRPLVRWAVEAACASAATPVVVVVGHRGSEVAAALADLPVTIVENPDFDEGLASSLRAGIAALEQLAPECVGALVCLGDMPRVSALHLDRLIAAFDATDASIVVPTYDRKRGNPVLWPRQDFPELRTLRGDVGARALLERHAERVCAVPLDDSAILLDVDTPQALAALRSSKPLED